MTDSATTVQRPSRVRVADLDLDPLNPRLPEEIQGAGQVALLEYLEQHDVLDELASSFVANGYFANEPIVILPANAAGRRVVVEGNRRTAALLVLLQQPAAQEAGLRFALDPEPDGALLAALAEVPCLEVATREELRAYLGYRHISGLRRWSAEAKARFISTSVHEVLAEGSSAPFYDVGRLLGSNSRGVRSAYAAYQLLRHGRDEAGLDIRNVLNDRFGVWSRALGTANVAPFIGFDSTVREYDEVRRAISHTKVERLAEVVSHLTASGDKPAVLYDSRDVTRYSDVLADEAALAVLREYRDLDLAAQLVEGAGLRRRIERLTKSCEVLLRDARRLDVDEASVAAAEDLAALADDVATVLRRGLRRATESR